MPDLDVHVVSENDKPISGAKVFLQIHHNIMPDTWLEEYTDSEGHAEFDVPRFTNIDIFVDGDLEDDIDIAEDDEGVTIYIDGDDDDDDDDY